MLVCKFCGRQCKNENSLRNHERLCKGNPNRQFSSFSKPIIRNKFVPMNGALKAKAEGREFIVSKETKHKISLAAQARTPEWNKENGKRIAVAVNAKVANGEWHTSLAKHMHIDYNGIDLHGSWELAYAKYLDANNIKWVRNKDFFTYVFEGKQRRYTPDFYLVDTDEYIEVKGHKTDKDSAKWAQFPQNKKLKILMKDELSELGLI